VTDLTHAVQFSGDITPNLTAITPRFGTVQGGETITFTGSGFSDTVASVSITLDGGFECVV